MATSFNPWEYPPETGALTGDLASFEINGESEAPETEAPELEDTSLAQALSVINQQSQLIGRLMDMLGGGK